MSHAEQLVRQLQTAQLKLALAESCTGGLVAAELARVPGVSNHFCGSAVTYRSETKSQWLGISPALIERHTAVSTEVAREMVMSVLEQTPEADVSASITGHLGPDAPAGFDGVVFIGTARRGDSDPMITRHQLRSTSRNERQIEAASQVLQRLIDLTQ